MDCYDVLVIKVVKHGQILCHCCGEGALFFLQLTSHLDTALSKNKKSSKFRMMKEVTKINDACKCEEIDDNKVIGYLHPQV